MVNNSNGFIIGSFDCEYDKEQANARASKLICVGRSK